MGLKKIRGYIILLFISVFLCVLCRSEIAEISKVSRLRPEGIESEGFRKQTVNDNVYDLIRTSDSPGEYLAVYWLESRFGREDVDITPEDAARLERKWRNIPGWEEYLDACAAIWDDLLFFPVTGLDDENKVSYVDSWMYERTYKGDRGHEGTDIISEKNIRGVIPVISMTDGVVENIGWLELGGYRVGIRAPRGAYFYYAHLDSYSDIKEGDKVKAGDLLGFMGDTGYGKKEGTRGKFPVHLHVGIYIRHGENELSVNPYPALKYLEDKRAGFQTA